MNRILVFGGAGFAGSNFITYVNSVNYGDEVFGTSKTSSDGFETADISLYSDVQDVILKVKPSHIVNFSGSFSNDYEVDYSVNLLGSKNILDVVVNNKLFDIKILLIGSSGEYGVNSTKPIDENCPVAPSSFYTLTKSFQTELMSFYCRVNHLNISIVRLSNLIGPHMSEKLFIGKFFKALANISQNQEIFVGNESGFRDYVDIRDAVRGCYGLLKTARSGEVYNLGSGKVTQIKTIIDAALQSVQVPRSSIKSENVSSVKKIDFQLMDIEKITKLIGFVPEYSIDDSIKNVLANMKK